MKDREKLLKILKSADLLNKGGSVDYRKIAEITGLAYGTVKNSLKPSGKLPNWVKLVLYVGEENRKG